MFSLGRRKYGQTRHVSSFVCRDKEGEEGVVYTKGRFVEVINTHPRVTGGTVDRRPVGSRLGIVSVLSGYLSLLVST